MLYSGIADQPAGTVLGLSEGGLDLGQDRNSLGAVFDYSHAFRGDLDEFSVWNRALTAGEVRTIHDQQLKGTEPGLKAWYRFNEATGTALVDAAGLNPPGQLGLNGQATTQPRRRTLFDPQNGLPNIPDIDLNSDGVSDLAIGARFSTENGSGGSGQVDIVYGHLAERSLPSHVTLLENTSIPGVGSFVIDRGSGGPELFDNGGQPLTFQTSHLHPLPPAGATGVFLDTARTFRWEVTANNGQIVPMGVDSTFTFAPLDDGDYTVKLTVVDKIGVDELTGQSLYTVVGTASSSFHVGDVAPTIELSGDLETDEGSDYRLTLGSVRDPGTDTATQFIVHWGDGKTNTYTQAGEVIHRYADDLATAKISVDVVNGDGTYPGAGELLIQVRDVRPAIAISGAASVNEGANYSLTLGTPSDPGLDTVTQYTVHWGDGQTDKYRSAGPVTHKYADGDGSATITVDLTDENGTHLEVAQLPVQIKNVVPIVALSGAASINEGATYSLTLGSVTDPGTDSIDSYVVDWDDGTQETYAAAEIAARPTITHVYADGTTQGVRRVIRVALIDEDGTHPLAGTRNVLVLNVAPSLAMNTAPQTVNEGALFDLASFAQLAATDPGFNVPSLLANDLTFETLDYRVNWGDGSAEDKGAATITAVGGIVAGQTVLTSGTFNATHRFADNGAYTVQITVSDDDGGQVSKTVTVNVLNVAPDLTLVADQTINEGETLNLSSLGSFTDPGFNNPANPLGATVETFTYRVHWGDGTADDQGVAAIDIPGQPGQSTAGSLLGIPAHRFVDNQVYPVQISVTDDNGGSITKTLTVTVNNLPPRVDLGGPRTAVPGTTVTFDGLRDGPFQGAFATDPGTQDSLTYSWTIATNNGTSLAFTPANLKSASFIPASSGVFTVSLLVTDKDGASGSASTEVNIRPLAAIRTPIGTQVKGNLLTFDAVGSTPLSTNNPAIVRREYRWQAVATSVGGAQAANVGSGPSFAFVPQSAGDYRVTLTITDLFLQGGVVTRSLSSTAATAVVTVGNYLPTITSLQSVSREGDSLTFQAGRLRPLPPIGATGDLLQTSRDYHWTVASSNGQIVTSDSPATFTFIPTDNGQYTDSLTVVDHTGSPVIGDSFESSSLSAVEGDLFSLSTAVTDAGSADSLTYTINWGDGAAAESGNLINDAQQGWQVQAGHIFADNGTYRLTLTVRDDDGATDQKTFNVTVANAAPTLTVISNASVLEAQSLQLIDLGIVTDPGFANASNPNGASVETFTYSVDWGDGSAFTQGSVTLDVIGGRDKLTVGSFDGNHQYADDGLFTVTVTVLDDDGARAVKSFAVTVNNQNPTLTLVGPQQTTEGARLQIADVGRFTDPGFDNSAKSSSESFTYSIDWGDGTPVENGSATRDVAGNASRLTAGSFDGSHVYSDNGSYVVSLTVTDDDGGFDTGTFAVTVDNLAPLLTLLGNQSTTPGTVLNIADLGKFSDPGFTQLGTASEETFTARVDWGDGTTVHTNRATVDRNGGAGQLTLGSFDGRHSFARSGQYNVSVTVSDDDGGATTKILTVNVGLQGANQAPSFTKGSDQNRTDETGAVSLSGWATAISAGPPSEAGQTLRFVVTNDNNGLFAVQPVIDATGKLTFTPKSNVAGIARVAVVLKDDGGVANGGVDTSASQTFNINVTKPRPWFNASSSLDVNADTLLTPLDAVLVINYLNARQPSQVPANATIGPPFIDTSGDNLITPLDAILVINALNAASRGAESGLDGESAPAIARPVVDQFFNRVGLGIESSAVPSAANEVDELLAFLATETENQIRKRRRRS